MTAYARATVMSVASVNRSTTIFPAILGVLCFMIMAMSQPVAAQGLLWAKRAGGTSSGDAGTSMAVDGSGNIYVTGIFQGSATFGVGEASQTTLTSTGGDDMFVARYDSTGALQWATRAGGVGLDRGLSIAVDGLGNLYVTGVFNGSATFGLGEVNQTTLTSAGGNDIFVAQYDSTGTLQWARRAGGTGSDHGTGIAVDDFGNIYVTGLFFGSATFGQGQTNQTTLNSAGSDEIFVVQYDFAGTLQWARRAGGTGLDQGAGIAVDDSGNIFVTGFFSGSATFGQGQANQTTLTTAGDRDIFVAQYDSIGTLVWVKRSGGAGADRGFSIALDGSGNIYVSGLFNGASMFGQGQANQTTLTSAGSDDIFVAQYDSNGTLQWVKRAGGTGSDGGLGIAADGLGNSHLTGFFSGSATFGQGEANQTTLTSAGNRDIFVVKYDSTGLLQWAKQAGAGGTSTDQGLGIAVDAPGNSYALGYFNGTATFGQGEANQTTLTSAGATDIFVAKFAGNNSSDISGPALAITSHTNNQTTTSSPITLSGTASDAGFGDSGISSVMVNGISASGGAANGSGTATWSQSVALGPGANLITVVAKDASPNQNTSTVQITINFSPTVTITPTDDTATEQGPTPGMFTVRRSGSASPALTVNYTVSGTATPGSDYFALSGSAVIPTGQGSAQIVITPVDDGVAGEGDETVVVTLTANAAYTIGAPSSATVTIIDNNLSTVTISATDDTATEQGPTPGVFTVSRSGSTSSALTVNYAVSGTATPGNDYQSLAGSVLIPTGQSSGQIVVTPIDDAVVGEGDETVVVTLTADAAYAVGAQSSATVTIIDNDLPMVAITATDAMATEQGPTPGIFTVNRNGSTSAALTVNYTVGGTATAGSDYQSLPGSVLIPAGQSSAQIVVTPIDDGILGEGDETAVVTLTTGATYTLGAQSSATVTIVDNNTGNNTAPGSLLWAKRAGSTSTGDAGLSTAVDGLGNVYAAGIIRGSATFGQGEANETTLTSAGSDDMFVAQYNSTGALQWAKRAGGSGLDRGLSMAVDGFGNIYVAGLFNGSATFGLGEANETALTSAGGNDIFVAQYDSNGALQWVERAGGTGSDQGLSIAVDGSGTASVTGLFNGSATFGQGQAGQTTLTSTGSDDIFVAQYDSNGMLQWAKRAGGAAGSDQGVAIALDSSGNTYLTGFFSGSATFAQGQANQTTLTAAGNRDIFVAKYDSIGTLLWAERSGGAGIDRSFSITVDGSGNSYLSGLFNGSATFGQGQGNQTTLTSVGLDDIFVARYDSSGALQWATRAGGTGSDGGVGIAVDGSGNSYVTGFFNGITHPGSATFGLGEPNETTLTSAGDRDIFVVKYDSGGLLQWAKRAGAGGKSTDQGMAIAQDGFGAIYTIGYFGDNVAAASATFGQGEANETTLTSAGGTDIFVAKFAGE